MKSANLVKLQQKILLKCWRWFGNLIFLRSRFEQERKNTSRNQQILILLNLY